jgi:hypothetical protein
METPTVYKIDQEKLKAFIRERITQSVIVKILLYAVFIVLMVIYLKMEGLELWVFVGSMVFLLGLFSWFRTTRDIKHACQIWDGYRLEVYEDRLVKQQSLYPEMTLFTKDLRVKTISRQGHVLVGASSKDELLIPSFLDNYSGAIQALGVSDVKVETKTIPQKFQQVTTWTIIPLMFGMLASANRWVVLACGTLLLTNLGYAIYRIYYSDLYDQRTKKKVFRFSIYFLLFLFLILCKFFGSRPGPIYSFFF